MGPFRRRFAAVLCAAMPLPALAQGLPAREGTCVATRIARLEHRLQLGQGGQFLEDSGSAVVFANGGYQVSYDELETVRQARVGDAVLMCLVRLPRNCPRGDARGRWYTTTDLRTMQSWTMMDAEHGCGGA